MSEQQSAENAAGPATTPDTPDDGLIEQEPLPVGRGQAKIGRPTDLSEAVQKRLEQAIRAGNTLDTAAAFAGIDRTTFRKWMRRGRKPKTPTDRKLYRPFVVTIEKALADAEAMHVTNITSIARGSDAKYDADGNLLRPPVAGQWTASAWWLERRNAAKWGRKEQVRHADATGGKLQPGSVVFTLDMGELPAARRERELREAQGGTDGNDE